MSTETTTVQSVDVDIDSILGADNVMLPVEKKPTVFSSGKVDLSFLDNKGNDEPDPADPENSAPAVDNPLDPPADALDPKTSGRKPIAKEGLVEFTNKMFEKKFLTPFDDEKPVDQYSMQDFEELFEANFQERDKSMQKKIEDGFYSSLPDEFKYAAHYLSNGGDDLKGLFRALGAVEEVREMDPKKEADAKTIVRSYLQATNFGDTEEIEEEINSWEDRGEIEAKAQKFKPKLDAMTKEQVAYKLQQQEQIRKQRETQAQVYMDEVYKTLEPAELNGLKLDKKTQNMLFAGLVQPNYPSMSGRNTNLMGHLLEKYQYMEPNHGLIAEALWLLADPDGYKSKVRENTKKGVVTDTIRKLKTEEANRAATTAAADEQEPTQRKPGTIQRPNKGFFKR